MKAGFYILITVIILMAGAIILALGFARTQAKLAPIAVCSAVLVLASIQLVKEIKNRKLSGGVRKAAPKSNVETGGSSLRVEVAWISGFILGIYLGGFIPAILIFCTAYTKTHGARWLIALPMGVVMSLFCYLVFSQFLRATLYPGLIFIWLGY